MNTKNKEPKTERRWLCDILSEAAKTLSELKRMHQLNYELIEQLNVTCQWIIDNKIEVPNADKLQSLIVKSVSLINGVQSETPTFIYRKLADEKKHPFRTDEDETEPSQPIDNRGLFPCLELGKQPHDN